jgi:tetratricopeptide (TPR) repeat protein
MNGDVPFSTRSREARRALADRLVKLRGSMSRQRAGRLFGERLGRGPLSAGRIGNFEQANYHQSLPSEHQLEALAEIYTGDNARAVADQLIGLLHEIRSCQQAEALSSTTRTQHSEQEIGTTKEVALTKSRGITTIAADPQVEDLRSNHADHTGAHKFYLRGRELLASNTEPDFVTGLALLRRACDLDPNLADAHAWMGYALWRRYFAGWDADATTLQLALNSATQALELDARCTGARMTLVRIYWDLGLHGRGLAEGITAAHESPGGAEAELALSRALTNAGMAELALPITQRVLCSDADNATAKELLIWNHLLLRQHEEVIQAARCYQQTNGLDANTAWALTAALGWLGRIREAERVAEQALRCDSANFTLWLLLGYIKRLDEDTKGAQLAWRQGIATVTRRLATHVTNYRATAWIANMQAGIGWSSEAISALSRIRIAEPINGYLHYRLATTDWRM